MVKPDDLQSERNEARHLLQPKVHDRIEKASEVAHNCIGRFTSRKSAKVWSMGDECNQRSQQAHQKSATQMSHVFTAIEHHTNLQGYPFGFRSYTVGCTKC